MTKNNKLKTINYKLITIVGPTAAGKTELAIRLTKKFGGEIVSADSRQVYKEMDIGTGKITKKGKRGIPHYLIDIVEPNEEFNAAIFKKLAIRTIKDIQKRGKLPFLVGGTGLYIQAIVDNIEFPEVPPQKKLRERLEKKSEKELFKIYQKLDSEGSKYIDKNNKRRLIRAIEVCKMTGKPFWRQREKEESLFDILELGIKTEKEKLKERVSNRVEKMIKSGLEQEVKNLVKKYGRNIPPFQTIGYSEWKDFFKGKININEVKNLITLHTLQFAKRQMTWFKRDKKIRWVQNCQMAEKLVKNFLKKT